ncbi:MAG: S8 family serine peptidase [Asgard group archaeon]|nr:S8 family serine peptidase [Asgard group archaeon]
MNKIIRRRYVIFLGCIIFSTTLVLLEYKNNIHTKHYFTKEVEFNSELSNKQNSPFLSDASSGDDSSLWEYLNLEKIFNEKDGTYSTYQVVIFDHLVDFTHPDLSGVISKIVLLPNNNNDDILEYQRNQLEAFDPYTDFGQYYASSNDPGKYGHGTQVAGIIHQLAPEINIISVAMRTDLAKSELRPTYLRFLDWLEDNKNSDFIINISSEWSAALSSNDMDSSETNSIAYRLCDLAYDRLNDRERNLLFICSAGNSGYNDIVFPANLADDWIHFPHNLEIQGKLDISGSSAKTNDIISVGAIYDHYDSERDINIGQRRSTYTFDQNTDGDLELMAPGFNLDSTFPTTNPYPDDLRLNYESFSGTSASAPVVCGLAALICIEYYYHNNADLLTGYELEASLIQNAIYDSNVDVIGDEKLQKYGYGMVNFIETLATINSNLDYYNSDLDSLLDFEELYLSHTDITLNDTDGDGYYDGTEFKVTFTDPNLADTDNDNIEDKDEFIYWGGKGLSDTICTEYCYIDDVDGDGLLDGDEINIHNTDPLEDDPDNDGLKDAEELAAGSNPFESDTDSDGLNDYQEVVVHFTNPLDIDTDGDSMNDLYEINKNLDPLFNDALLDPDNDGCNNIDEYNYGTNPHVADTDGDGMLDGWEIEYSLNPLVDDGMGDADGDGLYNIDEFMNNCDPTDIDTDNDGLNDKQEILNQCDPNDTDTDNDGWTDGFEVYTSGTEPDDADTDNDGLTDKNEYNYWVNTRGRTSSQAYAYIKDADVDNDNATDGTELAWGTDPLDNDSDNDGLYDGSEDLYYDTDPTDYDSDNDGYNDGEEVAAGTDPNDPNDHPGSGGGGGFGW